MLTAESRGAVDGSAVIQWELRPVDQCGWRWRVTYSWLASNLVGGDTNSEEDVFVRDRPSNLMQIATSAAFLQPATGFSGRADLSSDGKYVVYDSTATTSRAPDANGNAPDIFTHAGIVPEIDQVTCQASIGPAPFGIGPACACGQNTLRIAGKGFGPDASVNLGVGVTTVVVSATPTLLTVQATVANGSSGRGA